MTMKTRIYADSEEKWVKTTVLYSDEAGGYLYFTKKVASTGITYEDKVTLAEAKELFEKGVTIDVAGTLYKPTTFTVTDTTVDYGTMFCASYTYASSAWTVGAVPLYTKEYVAG